MDKQEDGRNPITYDIYLTENEFEMLRNGLLSISGALRRPDGPIYSMPPAKRHVSKRPKTTEQEPSPTYQGSGYDESVPRRSNGERLGELISGFFVDYVEGHADEISDHIYASGRRHANNGINHIREAFSNWKEARVADRARKALIDGTQSEESAPDYETPTAIQQDGSHLDIHFLSDEEKEIFTDLVNALASANMRIDAMANSIVTRELGTVTDPAILENVRQQLLDAATSDAASLYLSQLKLLGSGDYGHRDRLV